MNVKTIAACAGAALVLTGCVSGGGGTGFGPPVDLNDVYDAYAGDFISLRDSEYVNAVATVDMPTNTSARYVGVAHGEVSLSSTFASSNYEYIGEVVLDAEFTDTGGSFSGGVSDIVGADLIYIYDVDDRIAITNGVINGNHLTAEYSGSLDIGGNIVVIDGALSGQATGQGAGGVYLLSEIDDATVNQTPIYNHYIDIYAEQ